MKIIKKRQIGMFIYLFILFMIFVQSLAEDKLSNIALKYDTDKGPKYHNYTRIYNDFFENLHLKPIKLLEIGFLRGHSARMWEEYFPYAELHFIDINKAFFDRYAKNFSDRCHFHLVDQSNPTQLKQFIEEVGGDFDIIIDDGGHTMNQQITSFKLLFPILKNGGVYVIEDLFSSYIKSTSKFNYGGGGTIENPEAGPGTTVQFLKDLINDLNYVGARILRHDKSKCPTKIWESLNYYQKNIKSMHFFDIICFIYKR